MNQDPITLLEEEHQKALEVVARLEQAVPLLETNGARSALEAMRECTDFLRSEVRAHNEKEERALFPFLECLDRDDLIRLLKEEHSLLWADEEELHRSLEQALRARGGESCSSGQFERIATLALDLAARVRQHILKEDEALFPAVRQNLDSSQLSRISSRFQAIAQ